MTKPDNVGEYDGYPYVSIPADRKPLPKEKEDQLIEEMLEKIRKLKAMENEEKREAI